MTPQQIIDEARVLINDDSAVMTNRFTDAELLEFVNQAIKRACAVRPDLFITSGTITPTVGSASQELSSSITRLMEIHRVVGGDAVGEVDKTTMDRSYPEWPTEANGTPVNWMRHPRNPQRYYLYPPPATGTQLEAEYIEVPADYALGDTIAMPTSYKSALIDCVVFLAEILDNENVESQRAKDFHASFMQALGADAAQRAVVDNDDGRVNARQRQNGE